MPDGSRRGPGIAGQLLLAPVTDSDTTRPSYQENGEGYILTSGLMQWFWDHYADVEDRKNPDASPLQAPDLAGLPPALILSAEHDPLRDEGLAYGKRLEAAGVPVEVEAFTDMPHAFWTMLGLFERTTDAVEFVGGRIKAAVTATPA